MFGAEKPDLDCPNGAIENLSDFLIFQIIEIMQHDNYLVFRLQAVDKPPYRHSQGDIFTAIEGGIGFDLLGRAGNLVSLYIIQGRIMSNSIEPCLK